MTAKEFLTRTNCSDAELGERVNSGWAIHYMQFMADGKLNVVFVRDVKPAPDDQPAVTTSVSLPRVFVPRPIVNRKLPGYTIQGLGDVPITSIRKEPPPVDGDPVIEKARQVGKETFERVMAEGEARMKAAASSFRPTMNQGVTS